MYKIGDKVIPVSKSIGCSLYASTEWAEAKASGQNFLYIVDIDNDGDIWCSYTDGDVAQECFSYDDLKPYIKEKNEGKVLFQENMGVKFNEYKVKDILDLVEKGILKETDEIIVGRK